MGRRPNKDLNCLKYKSCDIINHKHINGRRGNSYIFVSYNIITWLHLYYDSWIRLTTTLLFGSLWINWNIDKNVTRACKWFLSAYCRIWVRMLEKTIAIKFIPHKIRFIPHKILRPRQCRHVEMFLCSKTAKNKIQSIIIY